MWVGERRWPRPWRGRKRTGRSPIRAMEDGVRRRAPGARHVAPFGVGEAGKIIDAGAADDAEDRFHACPLDPTPTPPYISPEATWRRSWPRRISETTPSGYATSTPTRRRELAREVAPSRTTRSSWRSTASSVPVGTMQDGRGRTTDTRDQASRTDARSLEGVPTRPGNRCRLRLTARSWRIATISVTE